MAGVTTAMPTSFKKELMEGIHHLQGTVSFTGTTSTATGTPAGTTVASVSSMADLSAGMIVNDVTNSGDIPASSYISTLLSSTSFKLDKVMTGSHSGDTLNAKGDALAFALIKVGCAGTYGAASVNYSDITGNSDEIANGSGYTTGGFTWAAGLMLTPLTSGTGAYAQPSTNPSWTSATISTIGGMLYNTTQLNKAIAVESFGGTQTVTAGTLTLLLPTNGVGTSLLQVN